MFNIDKHTLPQLYKFGLNRIVPLPVVLRFTIGGDSGKISGKNISNSKQPFSYGVPSGPIMSALKLNSKNINSEINNFFFY